MKNLGNFTFSFNSISHEDKELNKLKRKKVSQKTDIPIKIVKENVDTKFNFLYHNFNNLFPFCTFPTGMKFADVIHIHTSNAHFT